MAKEVSLFAGAGQEFNEANDPATEWDGMPEFNQQDKTAFRSILVHFHDEAGVEKFAKLVKQNITQRTRMLWYPEIIIETLVDKAYVDESQLQAMSQATVLDTPRDVKVEIAKAREVAAVPEARTTMVCPSGHRWPAAYTSAPCRTCGLSDWKLAS